MGCTLLFTWHTGGLRYKNMKSIQLNNKEKNLLDRNKPKRRKFASKYLSLMMMQIKKYVQMKNTESVRY